MAEREDEGRTIRNTDIMLLRHIFCILQEAESVERRGDWTYDRLFSITRRINGMPGGGGNGPGMDGLLAEVEELNRIYGNRLHECLRELKEAERILNGIPSRTMRVFVQMYYIDEIEKKEILRELKITEWKFHRIRRIIEGTENMKKVPWKEKIFTEGGKKSAES